MRQLTSLAIVVGLAIGASAVIRPVLAEPPAEPAKTAATQPASAQEEAAKKAIEAAIKKAQEAGANGAATPANAAPSPKGVPVPKDLPVVKTTELEGGLVVEDLKIGEGYEIKPNGVVVAYYHGTLKSDGSVFDSAFDRGEPAAFSLTAVVQGWQKGIPGMKIGGIRRLSIPAKLAWGDQSPSPKIPANSDVVFVVQMVDALKIEDEKVGEGEEAGQQPIVVTACTITGADGKVIESSPREKPYIWVPGEHAGIGMGLTGMKVGGKRKLSIPAQLNQTAPGAPNPANRPDNVPVTVELELLHVKNLVPLQPNAK